MIKWMVGKKLALVLLLAAANGSAGFDAWSTRRALRTPGLHEANPLVRPFAGSNAVYAATQLDVIIPELLTRKLPKKWQWVGYAWLVGATAQHVTFGVRNLRYPAGNANSVTLPQFKGALPGTPAGLAPQP